MKKRFFPALMATAFLASAGIPSAQATEGGGSYAPVAAQQQTAACEGTVTDDTGEPLVGATVKVVGDATKAASTDIDGKFSLKGVKAGSSIIVSYIGYNDKTVVWNGQHLDIKLSEAANTLDEVVVLGYTVQTKESLTGALTSIKDTKLKDVTTPNLANMLNGKVSGVYVAPGSGQPGAGAAVVIRGQASLSGATAPIWVVDGVIVGTGAGDLNPDDVESMTILKDAASTAIYGSDGANGVVVVTTKKGKSGEMKASASVKLGIANLNNGRFEVMDGAGLYDYFSSFQNADAIKFTRWTPELRNDNFSWWDLATHTGFSQDYHVSISGGNDKLNSYFSLGYYDEDGAVKGYKFQKYSFRATTEYKPYKFLTIRPTLYGSRRDIEDRQYSVSAMYSMLPWDSPYDEEGTLVPNRYSGWVNSQQNNYLNDLEAGNKGTSVNYEFNGNFDFDVQFTPWLKWQSVNSYRFNQYKTHSYTDPRSVGGEGVDGRIYEWSSDVVRKSTTQKLLFNKMFGTKHRLDGLLAYEYKDYKYTYMSATGVGFVPGIEVLDVTAKPEAVGGGVTEYAVQSYFTKWNYMYDNRYLLEAGFRRDGASNLGQRWGNLYSVSGGWIINRESWFNASWVNMLKVKASYGSQGNDNLGSRAESYYRYTDYREILSSGDGVTSVLYQKGNPDITWETNANLNVGVEFGLWDNRLSGSIDVFNRKTTDMLFELATPIESGYTTIFTNIGDMVNRGLEIELNADLIRTKNLVWDFSLNMTHYKNKVTHLPEQFKNNTTADGKHVGRWQSTKFLTEGESVFSFYVPTYAGVDPETGKSLWYTYKTDDAGNKERIKTSDYSVASQEGREMHGDALPDVYGGFGTSLRFYGVDFSIGFTYQLGGQVLDQGYMFYMNSPAGTSTGNNYHHDLLNSWTPENSGSNIPRFAYNDSNQAAVSDRFLTSASYLNIQNITLGYTLPKRITRKFLVENLRIYFACDNVWYWSKRQGLDPRQAINGITNPYYYAPIRTFSGGVTVTF